MADYAPLNDSSKMPFGKHKGLPMIEVPAVYLLWYWGTGSEGTVRDYIEDRLSAIEAEAKEEKAGKAVGGYSRSVKKTATKSTPPSKGMAETFTKPPEKKTGPLLPEEIIDLIANRELDIMSVVEAWVNYHSMEKHEILELGKSLEQFCYVLPAPTKGDTKMDGWGEDDIPF